jgi:hypothetical protein
MAPRKDRGEFLRASISATVQVNRHVKTQGESDEHKDEAYNAASRR